MTAPPDNVISYAIDIARASPCAKSKRGAVVFYYQDDRALVLGAGHNSMPAPLQCGGDCGQSCRALCVHAEVRAIGNAIIPSHFLGPGQTAELLHVKVVDGNNVPVPGPSCWQCSRHILDHGIAAVWLYEAPSGMPYTSDDPGAPGVWRRYGALEFHLLTAAACGLSGWVAPPDWPRGT